MSSTVPTWHPDYTPPDPPCTCRCHLCKDLCHDENEQEDSDGTPV